MSLFLPPSSPSSNNPPPFPPPCVPGSGHQMERCGEGEDSRGGGGIDACLRSRYLTFRRDGISRASWPVRRRAATCGSYARGIRGMWTCCLVFCFFQHRRSPRRGLICDPSRSARFCPARRRQHPRWSSAARGSIFVSCLFSLSFFLSLLYAHGPRESKITFCSFAFCFFQVGSASNRKNTRGSFSSFLPLG